MAFPIYPPPAYLDPPFISFSENFPPPLLFEPPRLLGTKEYGENSLYCASCYGYLRLRVQELS